MRQRWVYVNGEAIPAEEYTPEPNAPFVMGDIQPYKSMVTGEMITSRSAHRDHLKAHRLVEVGNETKHLTPKPKAPPPGLKERLIHEVNRRWR